MRTAETLYTVVNFVVTGLIYNSVDLRMLFFVLMLNLELTMHQALLSSCFVLHWVPLSMDLVIAAPEFHHM